MSDYYVDLDGKTAGPFTLDEMRGLYRARRISDETLFAKAGAVEWLPVAIITPLLAPGEVLAPPIIPQAKPQATAGDWVCMDCGWVGRLATITKGSIIIEIVLWLCFLIPGLIYSIWRMTSRYSACRSCRRGSIIRVDSPHGRELVDFDNGEVMFNGWVALAVIVGITLVIAWVLTRFN